MGETTFKIGTDRYPLAEVVLSAHHEDDDEPFLTVTLFADTKELSVAGFAINSISFRGLTEIGELQNQSLVLGPETNDPFNELGESVICKPGNVLELVKLSLKFGKITDATAAVRLEAVCNEEGTEVPVEASFVAKITV